MKTTLIGLFLAAASALDLFVHSGHSLLDWTGWLVPVGLALLGYHAADAKPKP